MAKFNLSTDSTVDFKKSYLEANGVDYIICKRILNGVTLAEIYDSDEEYAAFYESLKNGDLPSTTQLNPNELEEYFASLVEKYPTGDIVHIGISSTLSQTHSNVEAAAVVINEKLGGARKLYTIDSLSVSAGLAQQVDELIRLRDSGVSAEEAVKYIDELKHYQGVWLAVDDLKHLKRGGRISGMKTLIGTILNIKPILHINAKGKGAIESRQRGTNRAIDYIVSKIEQRADCKYKHIPVYILHTVAPDKFAQLKDVLAKKFPDIVLKEINLGPVVGTHVGTGAVGLSFVGKKRVDVD
ncbi:MAG: DegV family protein [Firmicutes bacterium]|nr:DegV family protein [Bacillota bacterium]